MFFFMINNIYAGKFWTIYLTLLGDRMKIVKLEDSSLEHFI